MRPHKAIKLPLGREHFRCIAGISTLTCLVLDVMGTILTKEDAASLPNLSRLTKLGLSYDDKLDFLGAMDVKGLQDLMLLNISMFKANGLKVLQHATGLTSLQFGYHNQESMRYSLEASERSPRPSAAALCSALSQMPSLQTLSLTAGKAMHGSWFDGIGLLTGLTALSWTGAYITNADVAACVTLKKLRVVSLLPYREAPRDPITFDRFLALARLPELSKVTFAKWMGISKARDLCKIEALVKTERHAKGWPPLDLLEEHRFLD